MIEEQWRDIPNTEGRYQASDFGRVRSRRRGNGLLLPDGEWRVCRITTLRTGKMTGYQKITIDGVVRWLHEVVAQSFLGQRPDGQVVRHKNGVGSDNRPDNLEWGTPTQNNHDTQLHYRGNTQQLTPEKALELKQRLAKGEEPIPLAEEYQISVNQTYKIRAGKSWGWLTPDHLNR